ncbi:MAG TPA: hypothetical protein VEQ10_17275 [Vicinamibacteria bacterium]|nr:hypothetical protein [Vicinamibacteria bacterium]
MEWRREALWWLLALTAGWALLAAVDYKARDPDSRLYAEISARTAGLPVGRWVAPAFPPGWYMGGLFREHPAGLFFPAAALARLGYPAEQAAYATNALYQVLSLVMLQRLAASVADGVAARALGWLLQLVPIAFTFRIRANQEQAVLMCLLAALLGLELSRRRRGWAVLSAAGLSGLVLVKGLFALLGPAVCVLWLLARRSDAPPEERAGGRAWLALGLGTAAGLAVAGGYEAWYRDVTGEPFWAPYLGRQLGVAAATAPAAALASASTLARKAYNLVWYLGRVLWFALPWSIVLLVAAIRWAAPGQRPAAARARSGAIFAILTVLLYLLVFSAFDRRADRYLFPAYYAAAAAGAVLALRASSRFRRLASRLDRPWVPATVWLVTFLLHVAGGRVGLPTVKVWTADQ